jgi:hypothetical protein
MPKDLVFIYIPLRNAIIPACLWWEFSGTTGFSIKLIGDDGLLYREAVSS